MIWFKMHFLCAFCGGLLGGGFLIPQPPARWLLFVGPELGLPASFTNYLFHQPSYFFFHCHLVKGRLSFIIPLRLVSLKKIESNLFLPGFHVHVFDPNFHGVPLLFISYQTFPLLPLGLHFSLLLCLVFAPALGRPCGVKVLLLSWMQVIGGVGPRLDYTSNG